MKILGPRGQETFRQWPKWSYWFIRISKRAEVRVRRVGSRVVASIPGGWKRVSVPAGVPRTARSCCRAIGYSWSPRSKLRDTTKRYRDRRPIDCLAVTSANALVYSSPYVDHSQRCCEEKCCLRTTNRVTSHGLGVFPWKGSNDRFLLTNTTFLFTLTLCL